MAEKKIERNGLVDFMRLVFALFITMYHFYNGGKVHFQGGDLGVEYFMILAGFLVFAAYDQRHIAKQDVECRWNHLMSHMKKRYYKFFWYALPIFIVLFYVVYIWHDETHDVVQVLGKLSGRIWDIFLVKMFGLNHGTAMLNVPTWTLGCMLFAEFFILGMLTFWERPFLSFLMPLSVIFGTGYWMNLADDNAKVFHTFFTFGMLRVYLLMCFGIFSYWLSLKLKHINFSNVGRGLLSVAEVMGYAMCLLIAFFRGGRNYQFCFILIATFVLTASFSGKSFAGSILPANKFTNFCAEYSFSLYLSHYPVLRIFRYTYEDIDDLYSQKFVFLICALTAALVYTFIMRGVFKMLPIVKQKLRSVMLEQT